MTTGIVIAGGSGTRFGNSKAQVILRDKTLIELVIEKLEKAVEEIIVVTSAAQYDNITGIGLREKIVLDIIQGKAAMGGVYSGLVKSNSFYSLVVACDMPLLNEKLLKYMISVAPGSDAVIPRINNYTEPLHAVYSKDCIKDIKSLIEHNNLSFQALFKLLKIRFLDKQEIEKFDPDHLSMFNINTVADMEKAKTILAAYK